MVPLTQYHEELEQLRNILAWKAAANNVTTKYKKKNQIFLSLRKKTKNKSDVYQ